MYDTILVPTDGSDGSERAIRHALGVASFFDAAVRVLYVVDVRLVELFPADRRRDVLRESDSEGSAVPESVVERAEREGIDAAGEVRDGVPSEVIAAYAEEVDADLVAMGAHRRSPPADRRLGSTAERVVERSPCPVLTVRQADVEETTSGFNQFDDLLVPVDGSDAAERAADHAVELAGAYGAGVHFVYVVDTATYGSGDAPRSVVGPLTEAGRGLVDELAAAAEDRSISATADVVKGIAHERILEYADGVDTDLVVMGTRGQTAGGDSFLGSTTDRVLRQSVRPVLTLR
jgi:nucleotide-binding universal stress UspA family protein